MRDGLVELRPDSEDRRTKPGVLARLGKKRLTEALVLWAAPNYRVEDVFGRDSAATLRALADQIASDEFLAAYNGAKELPVNSGRLQVEAGGLELIRKLC